MNIATVCVINSSGNIKRDALIRVMGFLLIFTLVFSLLLPVSSPAGDSIKRHILVVGLDGVSYETMLKMQENGYFKDFQKPIPLVSTFPSISDPNWAHIIGAEPEPGYTKSGYEMIKNADGSVGKEYGTLIDHITKPPAYESLFDFKAEGIFEHLVSMTWTPTSALYWTESLQKYLLGRSEHKPVMTSLIVNTDITSHMGGEIKLMEYLKELHKNLEQLRPKFKAKHKKDLEVVITSDHGNHYKVPISIEYKLPLAAKGFVQTSSLRTPKDYAFVAPEIIAFGAFYCLPESRIELAKEFASLPEIHVSLVDLGDNEIAIFSKDGEARTRFDPKTQRLTYKIVSGKDPFGHIQLFKNKSFSATEYFNKTLKGDYPNALVRAWEGFYVNSRQPASVLVSPKLGYVFTNMTLQILTAVNGVQSTHGSFHKSESLGVVMSTLPLKEEAVRPQDFLKTIEKL